MRAVVLAAPGPASHLRVLDVPMPTAGPGQVLLKVHAFGLNRSELHTRLGLAGDAVTFPRILGIEATGEVVAAPGNEHLVGRKAVTMMGGMGRTFDGGYAQYTVVPAGQVVPVDTSLDWARLGALPEVLQTAWGSMTTGMGLSDGDTVLVRGGTSSVGLMTALLGKRRGMTVLSTTRRADRAAALEAVGVDHVIVDTGEIAGAVRAIVPGGVDGAIELVGAPTLRDTLRCTRVGGTVCYTGMLSNRWIVEQFYPIEFIPTGVRLTAYGGGAHDLPGEVLSDVAEAIARGEVAWPVEVYAMDDIVRAHDDMEHDRVLAKQVVLTGA
ncbi:MAG: zinc-binding dehydrogenase [Alphaproteobacteria bacterium]|nr:zinc-binding dehydrogenase [Alphaproteobacteria bacterium]